MKSPACFSSLLLPLFVTSCISLPLISAQCTLPGRSDLAVGTCEACVDDQADSDFNWEVGADWQSVDGGTQINRRVCIECFDSNSQITIPFDDLSSRRTQAWLWESGCSSSVEVIFDGQGTNAAWSFRDDGLNSPAISNEFPEYSTVRARNDAHLHFDNSTSIWGDVFIEALTVNNFNWFEVLRDSDVRVYGRVFIDSRLQLDTRGKFIIESTGELHVGPNAPVIFFCRSDRGDFEVSGLVRVYDRAHNPNSCDGTETIQLYSGGSLIMEAAGSIKWEQVQMAAATTSTVVGTDLTDELGSIIGSGGLELRDGTSLIEGSSTFSGSSILLGTDAVFRYDGISIGGGSVILREDSVIESSGVPLNADEAVFVVAGAGARVQGEVSGSWTVEMQSSSSFLEFTSTGSIGTLERVVVPSSSTDDVHVLRVASESQMATVAADVSIESSDPDDTCLWTARIDGVDLFAVCSGSTEADGDGAGLATILAVSGGIAAAVGLTAFALARRSGSTDDAGEAVKLQSSPRKKKKRAGSPRKKRRGASPQKQSGRRSPTKERRGGGGGGGGGMQPKVSKTPIRDFMSTGGGEADMVTLTSSMAPDLSKFQRN